MKSHVSWFLEWHLQLTWCTFQDQKVSRDKFDYLIWQSGKSQEVSNKLDHSLHAQIKQRDRAIHCSSASRSLSLHLCWMQAVNSHGKWCRREDNAHYRSGILAVASICPNHFHFNPCPLTSSEPLAPQNRVTHSGWKLRPCEMGQHFKTLMCNFQYGVFSYDDFSSVTLAFLVLWHWRLHDRDRKQWTLKICSELHIVNQLT